MRRMRDSHVLGSCAHIKGCFLLSAALYLFARKHFIVGLGINIAEQDYVTYPVSICSLHVELDSHTLHTPAM